MCGTLFIETVNKHTPPKEHRIRKHQQPGWLKPDILDAIKKETNAKLMEIVMNIFY